MIELSKERKSILISVKSPKNVKVDRDKQI